MHRSKGFRRIKRLVVLALTLAGVSAPLAAQAAFGLTSDATFYTVDTGAGLVFRVRRTDNGSSTQSAGDIASLVFNGVQYQNQTRGSQVNSGFDFLYTGVSAVSVSATTVGADYIKITVVGGNLTHYYLARRGYPHIYMATYFTTEPDTLGLCRYIVRIPSTLLPNGPTPSDIRNNIGAIESGDVFGLSSGQTRSKHYSNERLIDWSYIGATGNNVGVWMVRDNNEGNSGGPFYRSLLNQCGDDQEITYIVNYGEAQTEALRTGILNSYALVFTTGAAPSLPLDNSWFSQMGLTGYVPSTGRGRVTGVGIAGRDASYAYTVGFSNSAAQYWAAARAGDGFFNCTNMLPGVYTMTIYKNELAVWTGSATVTAGGTSVLNTITITGDPSRFLPIWRIGDWDGTPREFLNGDRVTVMHPSDVRMSPWNPGTYVVGVSSPSTGFPCYQWRDVNGTQTVQFTLSRAPTAALTVRVGITCAYANARPRITVNSFTSAIPAISTQPSTRALTVGTYRGNNTTYTFNVPASAFVAGTNTLTVFPVSGSGSTGFLSAGYSVDSVDLLASPEISISDAGVTEGNSGATGASFTVTLSGASPQTITVNYATQPSTAAAPSDYTTTSGTLTFAPGETSKTVTVSVNGDTAYEPDETFFVNLSSAVNATIVDAQGRGTIRNDDNAAPVAGSSAVSTAEDTPVGVPLQASDANGDALTYTIVTGPAHGALSGTGASVTYTPAPDYNGTDSFTFKVNDGISDSNIATVGITVNPVNDPPRAAPDGYSTLQNAGLAVPAPGVLGNDTDVEGDSLSASVASGPSNGTLTLHADGSFAYTPNPGFSGADSFTYRANDSNIAAVTITVIPDPAISNVTARDITSSGATIAWTTNLPAGSTVEYGPTPAYGSTRTVSEMVTGHGVTLGGIAPGTLYCYRVRSADAYGREAVSQGYTFVSAPAGMASVAVTGATLTRVTIGGVPQIKADVTLKNSGAADAANVRITAAVLGSAGTITGLPLGVGSIAPGGSATATVYFASQSAGTSTSLKVSGDNSGGAFSSTRRVTVP